MEGERLWGGGRGLGESFLWMQDDESARACWGGSQGWLPQRRCEKMKLCSPGIKLTGSGGKDRRLPPICPSHQTPSGTRAEERQSGRRKSATRDRSHITFQLQRRDACECEWDSKATVVERRTFHAHEARRRSGADWRQAGVWLTGVTVGRGHPTQTLKQMRVVASENRTFSF